MALARYLRGIDGRLAEVQSHTFYAPALGPQSIVADLGASTAGFSHALAARYGCRCYAAEPLPENFRLIETTSRIAAFPVALSGTDGRIALGVRNTVHTSASFGRFDGLPEKDRIAVDSVTLDGFRRLAGVARFDLVKLDIEGAEFALFDAAGDEILRDIGQITVEFHDFLDPTLTPAVRAIVARLERLGFTAIRFTRHAHGDMLFVNRRFIDLSTIERLWFGHGVRTLRGLGRLLERGARPTPPASPDRPATG